MEKTVILCDLCKRRVMDFNCDFCKKDLCESCVAKPNITIWNKNVTNIRCCVECYKKLEREYFDDSAKDKIREIIVGEMRKIAIAKGLG